ncbi:uncharacterized protein LOC111083550, partial [Limulus polyphemus]|uniref:Uncharacterized protein LOC111083550 n=1 Tax=Limulus polyphemus TaxID=6850 RepID=A0ABM1RWU2_LIMPO
LSPTGGYGYNKKPEVWEYHGTYNYGFRSKKKKFGATKGALLALAGVPLLLAPLLSLLFIPALTIPTITVAAGRRKRSVKVTHLAKESEIQAVADYLKKVHYSATQQETVMAEYLQCNGMLSRRDHCLERLACEFSDPLNNDAPELERTVCSILLRHLLKNHYIPDSFKKRLKRAARYSRRHSGRCNDRFFCERLDTHPPEEKGKYQSSRP